MGAILRKVKEFSFRSWELSPTYKILKNTNNKKLKLKIEKKGNKIIRVNAAGDFFPTNFLLFQAYFKGKIQLKNTALNARPRFKGILINKFVTIIINVVIK